MDTGMFFVPTDLGVQFPTCSPSVHLPGPVSSAFHPSDPPDPLLCPPAPPAPLQAAASAVPGGSKANSFSRGLDFSSSAARLFVSR